VTSLTFLLCLALNVIYFVKPSLSEKLVEPYFSGQEKNSSVFILSTLNPGSCLLNISNPEYLNFLAYVVQYSNITIILVGTSRSVFLDL